MGAWAYTVPRSLQRAATGKARHTRAARGLCNRALNTVLVVRLCRVIQISHCSPLVPPVRQERAKRLRDCERAAA